VRHHVLDPVLALPAELHAGGELGHDAVFQPRAGADEGDAGSRVVAAEDAAAVQVKRRRPLYGNTGLWLGQRMSVVRTSSLVMVAPQKTVAEAAEAVTVTVTRAATALRMACERIIGVSLLDD
jgi:hypothetical protein